MKYAAILTVFCAVAGITLAKPQAEEPHKCDFAAYVKKWGKTYDSQEERDKAKENYLAHCEKVRKHNNAAQTRAAGKKGFEVAENQFSDLSNAQFIATHTGKRRVNTTSHISRKITLRCAQKPPIPNVKLPASYDARKLGLVNTPEHQGNCGCCFAFSANGAIEAAYKRQYQKLINLSEQQIASCDVGDGNNGCNGGDQWIAYSFANAKGIVLDKEYPYTSKDIEEGEPIAACQASRGKPVVRVQGCSQYVDEEPFAVEDIQKLLVQNGVLAASMDASGDDFQNYKKGIFRGSECQTALDNINHAVLMVGYGTENGEDYWIIKNSWGVGWGEQGYFRIPRGENTCAMELDFTYVTKLQTI